MSDEYRLQYNPITGDLHYGPQVARLGRIVAASFAQVARGCPEGGNETLRTIANPLRDPGRDVVIGLRCVCWTLALRVAALTGREPDRVLQELVHHLAAVEAG